MFAGPVLGAVLITLLQSGVSLLSNSWLVYVGVMFIAMVIFAPEGLSGIIMAHGPLARHRRLRRLIVPYLRLLPGGVLHAATDHRGYAEQIAAAGDGEPRLRRAEPAELETSPASGGVPISVQRPATKYETKARTAGSAVTELVWVRRA